MEPAPPPNGIPTDDWAAVLWRKGSFGAQSAAGNTFIERVLTVSATCRQQNRHLHIFLSEAVLN